LGRQRARATRPPEAAFHEILTSPRHRADAPAFLALVRHARAVAARSGEPDGQRALSPEGREEFQRQLARLAAADFRCDVLWSSPLLRARQTAALLGSLCGVPPEEREGLGSDPASRAGKELVAEASARARTERVVLVGHQPWLAEIARSLGASEVADLDCGEVVWLTAREHGGWRVAARLYPA
jgi:phosphohistidine phosphatase